MDISEATIFKKLYSGLFPTELQFYDKKFVKFCFFNRFTKQVCLSKAKFNPSNKGLMIANEFPMSIDEMLELCEKIVHVDKDNPNLFEIISSNSTRRLVLCYHTTYGIELKSEIANDGDEEFDNMDLDDEGSLVQNELRNQIKWEEEFYKFYFARKDNVVAFAKKMRELCQKSLQYIKTKEDEKKQEEKRETQKRKKSNKKEKGNFFGNEEISEYIGCITLMEFSKKLNQSIRDCIIYNVKDMEEHLKEIGCSSIDVIDDVYKKYTEDELNVIYNDYLEKEKIYI